MKFLSNTHDPKDKEADYYILRSADETQAQAIAAHHRWLDGKVIGRPQATKFYSVEQLEARGVVGVYLDE